MKTIIMQKIDDYDIIVGIGEPCIDPVATYKIVDEKLPETAEFIALDKAKKEMLPIIKAGYDALKNAKDATSKTDKNKYTAEYQQLQDHANIISKKIEALVKPVVEKKKALIIENAIYFHPKPGEIIVENEKADEVILKLQEATQANKYLDINLNLIDDNCGKTYYKKSSGKWSYRTITKIGDVPADGEKLADDLSAEQKTAISEQFEADRIATLTTAQKKDEKAGRIAWLTARAAQLKSEYEIQGDKKALENAQAWLATETAKVEKLYA